MVKKMNKKEFIKDLSNELNYSEDKCIIINDILESNFFVSKKSKEPIIEELISKLNIENQEANHIYDVAIRLIKEKVKDSLKHPFRNKG